MEASNDKSPVKARIKKDKELLISQLKKTPIIQISCEKIGVGRATYYRWRKLDKKFLKAADEAILEGTLLINDMAESQLIAGIRDRNMTAIIFWLKNRHPSYEPRLEIKGVIKKGEDKLTKRQEEILAKALNMTKPRKLGRRKT